MPLSLFPNPKYLDITPKKHVQHLHCTGTGRVWKLKPHVYWGNIFCRAVNTREALVVVASCPCKYYPT